MASRRNKWWLRLAVGLALVLLGGVFHATALGDEGANQSSSGEAKPKAYSANVWWVTQWGHASAIKVLIDALGYDTLKDEPPTKANAVAAAPDRLVWYSLTDGAVDITTGEFFALTVGWTNGDYLYPSDLPGGLAYKLVFLNACYSASGPVATQFADAFGATACMGWLKTIGNPYAVQFATKFFTALKGHRSVQEAVNTVMASYTPGGPEESEVAGNIQVLRGGSVVVEL